MRNHKIIVATIALAAATALAPVSAQAAETPVVAVESGDASAATTAAILALQVAFPEGTVWNDANQYYENSQAWTVYGTGCSAFGMQVSDAIYGASTPVTRLYTMTPDDLRAGDYVRIDGVHTVIVLQADATAITVCEGNWNNAVHWGRVIPKATLQGHISYVARRG